MLDLTNRQIKEYALGALFLVGGLRCIWRALRAVLTGRADSSGAGITVYYDRTITPWHYSFTVASGIWLGLIFLLLAQYFFGGFKTSCDDRRLFGILLLPVGPLFLFQVIRALLTGKIDYAFRGAPPRRYGSTKPLQFAYAFLANLFLGLIGSFLAWFCFH